MQRRRWIQQSLLASSAVLTGGVTMAGDLLSTLPADDPLLRLNWNENPYGPAESAVSALVEVLHQSNHYPDAIVSELKEDIGSRLGVAASQVMLTAGSTEVLSLLGQHVALLRGEILTPWPSFPTMMHFGERCGATICKIPLDQNYRIDLQQTLEAISDRTALVFICNPNNPTSTEVDTDDLRQFCKAVPGNVLVCVDEAYIEYSNHGEAGSMVSLVSTCPNLVICRTFSKAYGLAGLRIGYAISSEENINALLARHTGWEMSAGIAPLTAARATMKDSAFLANCVAMNDEGRKVVQGSFSEWGVGHPMSSTNFIYAESKYFVDDIMQKLRAEDILITKWPDMHDHIRISIGKPDQMRRFVEVAETFLV